MSSSAPMDLGMYFFPEMEPPLNLYIDQSTYTAKNLATTALQCSEYFRRAVNESLIAPLKEEIAELHHTSYNLDRDCAVQARQINKLLDDNKQLAADLDACVEDVSRLRRQRDRAEAHISDLRAQSDDVKPSWSPLLAYSGDIKLWPQFVRALYNKIDGYPQDYSSDRKKCLLLLKFMIGPAKKWAELFLATAHAKIKAPELDNFQVLVAKATLAWGDDGKEAQTCVQLMNTRLEAITTQELTSYHQRFNAFAARISWSEPAILQCYKLGLPLVISRRLEKGGVAEEMNIVQDFVIQMVEEMEKEMMG